jgi:hypothetical protein
MAANTAAVTGTRMMVSMSPCIMAFIDNPASLTAQWSKHR